MPFLGRDWRAPGDQWVRTGEGWERLKLWRLKLFESLNENLLARLRRLALINMDNIDWVQNSHQPHIHFVKGTAREMKIHTSLSEAFLRLDMAPAIKDIRRFNYVCKVLEILICQKLNWLSGNAQKHIFNLLEDMLNQVLKTQNNVGAFDGLLKSAVKTLNDGQHSHIGSAQLWSNHEKSVKRMLMKFDSFQLNERQEDGGLMISDLPSDCIRDILLRMTDHKDIIHAGQTSLAIHDIAQENHIWKQLCFFHFSNLQLVTFLPKEIEEDNVVDWKTMYMKCVRRFGKRHVYADMLATCKCCDCIFWQSCGHPCVNEKKASAAPLTPEAFINLLLL